MTPEQAQIQRGKDKLHSKCKEGFDSFMESPLVRLTISQIPATENGTLQTLLSACYNAGFDNGLASAAISLAEAMFKTKKEP